MVGHVFFVKTENVIYKRNTTPRKKVTLNKKKAEYTEPTIEPYKFDRPTWLKK